MTPVERELFLVGAGAVAGLVGTAGGITSLVSYPALLLAGIAPLQANVANIVALVACWPGSALASRPELAEEVRGCGAGESSPRWEGPQARCCCWSLRPACSARSCRSWS